MAYVLGFFAADGYMTVNKRGGHFWNIHINDEKLLLNIRRTIKSEHKISRRVGKGNENDSYRLQIGSKEMYQDLYNLGMRPNKTKSLVVPNIPDYFFKDFVRGYFDGDGNVWTGHIHKNRKTSTLVVFSHFTSCSLNFLQALRDKLSYFGVGRGCIYVAKRNYARLQYSTQSSLKLYDFMYNELCSSEMFLTRKKVVFERYIKNAAVV